MIYFNGIKILLSSSLLIILLQASIDGKSKKPHKWKLMKPGTYHLESLPTGWESVSDLKIICDRKDGYEYLERVQFMYKDGNGKYVSTGNIPLTGFKTGSRLGYQLVAEQHCFRLEIPSRYYIGDRIELKRAAFCPTGGDSWEFIPDDSKRKDYYIMVREEGPVEAPTPMTRHGLTRGNYTSGTYPDLQQLTMTITKPAEATSSEPYAFRIGYYDPESKVTKSTDLMTLNDEKRSITHPFLMRERAVNGCYSPAIIRKGSPVSDKLCELAGIVSAKKHLSVCPIDANSVKLVLNRDKYGTEEMKSVKFTIRDGSGLEDNAHMRPQGRKRPSPTDNTQQSLTPTKQTKLTPVKVIKEGQYVPQESDGEGLMSIVFPSSSSEILFEFPTTDFLSTESFSLKPLVEERKELSDGCLAIALHPSDVLLLTRLVETANALGNPDDDFKPEKGVYLCPDGNDNLNVYFGGLSSDAGHTVKVNFQRVTQ